MGKISPSQALAVSRIQQERQARAGMVVHLKTRASKTAIQMHAQHKDMDRDLALVHDSIIDTSSFFIWLC